MRWLLLAALVACGSPESTPDPVPETKPAPVAVSKPKPKPPDEMDERMRHCPLALDGAESTLEDITGGVRFTVSVPDSLVAEARRRAHHIVEFAAKKTSRGHGEFDGKGGGRMKNCPIVTDRVTITVAEIVGGARIDITSERVDELRTESRVRAKKFPFAGATITIAARK